MPAEIAGSRPGLKNLLGSLSPEVQEYFKDLPSLVDGEFSLDIVLAYVFFRIEQGQRQALFCGARKLHRTEASLTRTALDRQHMTREAFDKFFDTIFGFSVDSTTKEHIRAAEEVRDRVMHGRRVDEPAKRKAISLALHYAQGMNHLIAVTKDLGFRPFTGDLRGFTGALGHMDKSTTRWILKGMGFCLD